MIELHKVAIAVTLVALIVGLPLGACASVGRNLDANPPCHNCCPKPASNACHNAVCICLDTPQAVIAITGVADDSLALEVSATFAPVELRRETAVYERSAVYSPPDPYLTHHQILI